jgi:hypothetical protein
VIYLILENRALKAMILYPPRALPPLVKNLKCVEYSDRGVVKVYIS